MSQVLGEFRQGDRLLAGMALAAIHGILNNNRLLDVVLSFKKSDDKWAFLNVVLADRPSAKFTSSVGAAITVNAIH
jgi:hypothetical protein